MRWTALMIVGALLGCREEPEPGPFCGDGLLDSGEECDNGDFNDDTTADECRTSCRFPSCGDGVTDFGETCDDGNNVDFDGCSSSCVFEGSGTESEPNDRLDQAEALEGTERGGLSGSDRDCFRLDVQTCDVLSLELNGECADGVRVDVFDAAQNLLAVKTVGCEAVDFTDVPGPVLAGSLTVCLSAVGADVPRYELSASLSGGVDGDAADDDADGWPDVCDRCPDDDNSLEPRFPQGNGWIRPWLLYAAENAGSGCTPTGELLTGEATLAPAAGDDPFEILLSGNNAINLSSRYSGQLSAPRESLAVVYVDGDSLPESVTVSYGSDDGALLYWNGENVDTVDSCQGVRNDQFSATVTVQPGWNRLALRIRDQGGGWGYTVRLRDTEGNNLSDYALSLDPFGAWRQDQRDSDGDGVADVCD
ncbi:MAG: DUF4215 domain-containing protein [Myxococcota bacterium]